MTFSEATLCSRHLSRGYGVREMLEVAKVDNFAGQAIILVDARVPFPRALIPAYTSMAAGIMRIPLVVSSIYGVRYIAEVAQPIIVLDAILVIDVPGGPISSL